MLKKLIALSVVSALAAPAFAQDSVSESKTISDDGTLISIDYKVWFQDHETMGARYVSAQNNIIKLTAHTQDGFIPNVSLEAGKAESNLFAYTETEFRVFYEYDYSEALSFDYGVGVSARYDARHGKPDDAATLGWNTVDPQFVVGVSYQVPSFTGLTLFSSLEKRVNKDNTGLSAGTTSELGARYVFLNKGNRSIAAEIGYRRDIQQQKFTVTKTKDDSSEDGDAKAYDDAGAGTGDSTYTEIENRRMIGDGFYLGVRMTF